MYSIEFSGFLSLLSFHYFVLTQYLLKQILLKSIKALETRISLVLTLIFINITISSCFFIFFFVIDLYFLIPAVIAQIYNLTTKLVIRTRAKIVETEISKCSRYLHVFLSFSLIKSLCFISS